MAILKIADYLSKRIVIDKPDSNLNFLTTPGVLLFWFGDSFWKKSVIFPEFSSWDFLLNDTSGFQTVTHSAAFILVILFSVVISIIRNKVKGSQGLYQQLFNNVTDAVLITPSLSYSDNKKYVDANEAACKMLGYTREQLLQLSPETIIDPERAGDLTVYQEMLRTQGLAMFETVILTKTGTKIPVEINSHALHFQGKSICLTLIRDISSRLTAEKAVRELEQQLLILTRRLLDIKEEERGRLSQELHDELGQRVMFLKMEIGEMQKDLPPELSRLKFKCGKLLGHLEETAENIRRLVLNLKPEGLERLGFSLAVNLLIKDFCQLHGIKSTIKMEEIEDSLSPEAQLHLFRIFQESLTNIGKHAGATEIAVETKKKNGRIFIKIQDNGKGYDFAKISAQPKVMGLSTIRERARLLDGKLIVQSLKGKGSEINLVLKL